MNMPPPEGEEGDDAGVTRFFDAGMLNIVAQLAFVYRLGTE